MDAVALLPCPFCGAANDANRGVEPGGRDDVFVVSCTCGAAGPEEGSPDQAGLGWNQRQCLPCLFCGESRQAQLEIEILDSNATVHGVTCLTCKAAGPVGCSYEEAVHAWNSRTNLNIPKETPDE